jgi:hypothetical protein
VHGGTDEKEGHKERLHARGGIPGVFFSYVSSSHSFLSVSLESILMDDKIGYLAHESRQQGNACEDIFRLLGRGLRVYRRYVDGRRCCGQDALRGPQDGEEAASGLS